MDTTQVKILVISNYRSTVTVRPEAEIFIGLARMGFQITIMTYGDSAYIPHFKEVGIKVIDFHPQKKFDRDEIRFIRTELIDGDYHIVHLFNGKAMINGLQAVHGLSAKVILYRGYEGNIHWYDPSIYFKFLNPRVDAILCNSKGVEEYVKRAMVLVKNKTVTINKGHRLEWYADVEPIDRKELGLAKDDMVLVCGANNRRMKGIPYLLQSLHHLPPNLRLQLLLVGRDMDTDENLKIVRHSAYADRVHFLGFRKDNLRIVKMADFFVLASLYGESITKSVLESMSLGTPAIITDIPGNREMIENGKSGLVVPKKDPAAMAAAILKTYENRSLSLKMGQAAKERIQNRFHSDITIKHYAEFYEELLGDS